MPESPETVTQVFRSGFLLFDGGEQTRIVVVGQIEEEAKRTLLEYAKNNAPETFERWHALFESKQFKLTKVRIIGAGEIKSREE